MLFLPYYVELLLKVRGRFRPVTREVLEDSSWAVEEKCSYVKHSG
jgi:hypothetical protein